MSRRVQYVESFPPPNGLSDEDFERIKTEYSGLLSAELDSGHDLLRYMQELSDFVILRGQDLIWEVERLRALAK